MLSRIIDASTPPNKKRKLLADAALREHAAIRHTSAQLQVFPKMAQLSTGLSPERNLETGTINYGYNSRDRLLRRTRGVTGQ